MPCATSVTQTNEMKEEKERKKCYMPGLNLYLCMINSPCTLLNGNSKVWLYNTNYDEESVLQLLGFMEVRITIINVKFSLLLLCRIILCLAGSTNTTVF